MQGIRPNAVYLLVVFTRQNTYIKKYSSTQLATQ